jgi:hypothetical protein
MPSRSARSVWPKRCQPGDRKSIKDQMNRLCVVTERSYGPIIGLWLETFGPCAY